MRSADWRAAESSSEPKRSSSSYSSDPVGWGMMAISTLIDAVDPVVPAKTSQEEQASECSRSSTREGDKGIGRNHTSTGIRRRTPHVRRDYKDKSSRAMSQRL